MPPFLGWAGRKEENKSRNIAEGLKEGLDRIEGYLVRSIGKQDISQILDQAFDRDLYDVYLNAPELDHDEFDLKYKAFSQRNARTKGSASKDSRDNIGQYLSFSVAVLESFVLNDFPATLIKKFLGSLAKIMEA